MLLVSETVSPALTGGDDSVPTGLLAAATLMGLGALIENGKLRPDADLRAKLHEHGLLRVDEVRRAYVEADGEIPMIPRAGVGGHFETK